MFKKLLISLLLIPFLSGCVRQSPCRVVTGLQVASGNQQYIYSSPKKIEKFLYYLRSLDTLGPAELDQLQGQAYQITLTFSDGRTKVYRQKGSMCLAVNDGGWLKIDSDNGDKLPLLLEAVPADK